MSDVKERYGKLFGRGEGTDRMQFFSDAVFAIALTLLVIDIKVPSEVEGGSFEVLAQAVPSIYAYILSFYVIAVNWMAHHRKFGRVQRLDGRLISLNFLLLFVVAFVPFPTSMIAEYPGEVTSVVLYAGVVAALSLLQLATWAYAVRAGHVDPAVDGQVNAYLVRVMLVVPTVFAISILIAILWDPFAAMWSWIALAPAQWIVGRIGAAVPDRASAVEANEDSPRT